MRHKNKPDLYTRWNIELLTPFPDAETRQHNETCAGVLIKWYSIMMLMKFADLSQSNRSNWVMWQVTDPCSRAGWDGCLTREKIAFIKSVKTIILLYIYIAVHLITSLKSKWKISKWKIWIAVYDTCFFYQFSGGNLLWNSWICKMIDYLKGSIVKFNLNFENALENKCESI